MDGHDRNMRINTESPRLAVTPGEWYARDLLATTSTVFRQMDRIPDVIGTVKIDCRTIDSPRLTVSPAPAQIEPLGEEDFRCSMDQTSVSSTYINLDALSSSSEEESMERISGI